MSNVPSVSVVIPTYRHAGLVERTLESVFAQTLNDLEVIVVNDGSPDDTTLALQPLIQSKRITYVEQANKGQSSARNCGIRIAKGKYIALLDDDDLLPKDKLAWQVECLERERETVLVYGFPVPFWESLGSARSEEGSGHCVNSEKCPSGWVHKEFLCRNWIVSPGQTMIRSSVLKEIEGFDESIWGADDYELYIRLALKGRFNYKHQCALYYRKHNNNASRDTERMYANIIQVRNKHLGILPKPGKTIIWIKNWIYYRRYFYERKYARVLDLIQNGQYVQGRRELGKAVYLFPPAVCRRSLWKCIKSVFIR